MISVHFIGRVGKDAQVISGQHGEFLTMDVAEELYTRGENKTRWTRIRTSDASIIKKAKYFTKGKPLEIRGELMEDNVWESNGEKHWQHTVKATSIDFVPGGKKRQEPGQPETTTPSPSVVNSQQPFPPEDKNTDDLPF